MSLKKNLLVISNGETEDFMACQIIDKMPKEKFNFLAAPLVSHGKDYTKRNIPIICPTNTLPSKGFNNQSVKSFLKDLRSGLGTLTLNQITSLRQQRQNIDYVFTCGDVLPQIFGLLSGKPYASFFTALSEFYIRDKKGLYSSFWKRLEKLGIWHSSTFTLFDRSLMYHPKCLGVFVRDRLTHDHLKKFTKKAYFFGNPMMDDLQDHKILNEFNPLFKNIVLLPGSRTPEVYYNLKQMVKVVQNFRSTHYNIALNLTGHMDKKTCQKIIQDSPLPIYLLQNYFSSLLNQGNLAFAMCGTAAEQAVGKSLPVVSMPGKGPQFIPSFAKRQEKLLGTSYFLINENEEKIAQKIETLLQQENKKLYQENAFARMGKPGGSQGIADKITDLFS